LLSPVAIGFGDTLPHGLNLAKIGALVVGPVSAVGRGYSGPATLVEADGALVVQSSGFSRSARRAVERYGAIWQRLACPVIVHLVDATVDDLARSARQLAHAAAVAAIEWNLPPTATPALVADGVRTLTQVSDAPIWVKLPLTNAVTLATRAVAAGAVGVVVGQAPMGAAPCSEPVTKAPALASGALHGPGVYPLMLNVLREVAAAQPGCALIACGGAHHAEHIRCALASGAHAVQIDSAVWRAGGAAQAFWARE
jgi:dihydroorotate dehydrogenase